MKIDRFDRPAKHPTKTYLPETPFSSKKNGGYLILSDFQVILHFLFWCPDISCWAFGTSSMSRLKGEMGKQSRSLDDPIRVEVKNCGKKIKKRSTKR